MGRIGLTPESNWLSHQLQNIQQHTKRQAMQMLQRLEEGRVCVSCRLRGTCKHMGCSLAWEVNMDTLHNQRQGKSPQQQQ